MWEASRMRKVVVGLYCTLQYAVNVLHVDAILKAAAVANIAYQRITMLMSNRNIAHPYL